MASYDIMTFQFHSSFQVEDVDGYDHHHPHNLSSTVCCVDDAMATYMSVLSIEGDDAEFSDRKELLYSSDCDENELSNRYPLPVTPPRGNEAQKTMEKDTLLRKRCRRMRKDTRSRIMRKKNRTRSKSEKKNKENVMVSSGESDENRLRIITRPKGRRRSLCINLEEVKSCRDLDEIPSLSPFSPSNSNSTLDTSSVATSPIANWCIFSPGDDPRDVKARLKMWAQAVATSAFKYGT